MRAEILLVFLTAISQAGVMVPVGAPPSNTVVGDISGQAIAPASVTTTGNIVTGASGNLGIGTASPAAQVDVSSGIFRFQVAGSSVILYGGNNTATPAVFQGRRFGGGSYASPATVNGDQNLVNFAGTGFDSASYPDGGSTPGIITLLSSNTWSASNHGVYWQFITTPMNSITRATVMTIADSGRVGIGATRPSTLLHVSSGVVTVAGTGAGVSVYGGVVLSSTTQGSIACNAGTGVLNATANDQSGRYVAGTAAANCTITFGTAYPKTPACWCNDETNILVIQGIATTTTLKCTAAVTMSGDTISYGCQGSP